MAERGLSLSGVTAGYGPTHVLRDIDLDIAPGERVAVIGRNGAGKTTLLATIMALTRLHGGEVRLDGQSIARLAPFRRNRLGLGLVPQTRAIFPSLSVEENLLSAMQGDADLDRAWTLFPRLKERRKNGGHQLSGGEQQMLAVARTLMTGPRLLLLDEPLEGLAPVIRETLMEAIEALAAGGEMTVVLVEQQVEAALSFADRAVLMANGRIVHDGPVEALRADPGLLDRHVGVAMDQT